MIQLLNCIRMLQVLLRVEVLLDHSSPAMIDADVDVALAVIAD